ncbi:MAG: glycosyltransferase family protein [Caulobacteraceae bacterium]
MLAILQARMSSSRLPGKVLMPLAGEPMIGRQVERLKRAEGIDRILVATSTRADDDPLAAHVARLGVEVFRGDLDDVLDRFHGALAAQGEPEHFLRLTADCPLADPGVIDLCIRRHRERGADYTHNSVGRTYPKGLDVEVCRTSALNAAWRETRDPYDREHVTPFIYRRPERFHVESVTHNPPLRWRWTVDTPQDYAFASAVYDALYKAKPDFDMQDVLDWQAAHPEQAIPCGADE